MKRKPRSAPHPNKALGKLVLPAKYTKTKVTFFLLCVAKGKDGDRVLFLGTEERNDGLAIGAWMDTFARGRKDGLPIDFSYSVSDPGLYGQVYVGLPPRSVKVLSGDIVRLPFEQIALPNSAGKADVYYAPLLINETSTFRGVHRHHGLAVLRSPQGKIIWIVATNSKFSEFRRVPAGTNKPVNQILRRLSRHSILRPIPSPADRNPQAIAFPANLPFSVPLRPGSPRVRNRPPPDKINL